MRLADWAGKAWGIRLTRVCARIVPGDFGTLGYIDLAHAYPSDRHPSPRSRGCASHDIRSIGRRHSSPREDLGELFSRVRTELAHPMANAP
jgi:hypothetical protein